MHDRVFRVLKTLGGCGGTIVSRSLAACGAVVLSEVNPRSAQLFAGALNPLVQVKRDYPELLLPQWRDADPTTLGKPEVFGQFISDVQDVSERPVLIRDYSYVDYIGTPFVWPVPESPSLDAALQPFGSIQAVLLVRQPLSSLRSLLRHGPLASTLTAEQYLRGHIAFMETNSTVPIARFEEFLMDQNSWLKSLCASLALNYSADWSKALASVPAMTGNAQARVSSEVIVNSPDDQGQNVSPHELISLLDKLLLLCGYNETHLL